MKSFKHSHGTRNPILAQEEEALILTVERSLASTSNSQTIGRNGELPFLQFLQRYLPTSLRAVSGHFLTPSGALSPQIDVIVADARYPLLAQNADGSALVMLHSVIRMFEVKTNATAKDIKQSLDNAAKTMSFVQQIDEFQGLESWSSPRPKLISYKCAAKLATIETLFFGTDPSQVHMDAVFLRYHPKDQEEIGAAGGVLHFEPPFPGKDGTGPLHNGWFPMSIPQHTPLSDLYYSLVQDAYYTLGARDYSFSDIGAHVSGYMSWSTAL